MYDLIRCKALQNFAVQNRQHYWVFGLDLWITLPRQT